MVSTTPPGTNGPPPTLDDLLVAFADLDRRRLLVDLQDGGSQTITGFVVAHADGRDHERFRTRVRHHHLPRLEQDGLIHVHEEIIDRGGAFDRAAPFLDLIRANADEIPGTVV